MCKIAVVTGAASGIGEEAAHDLVARDWTVYGLDVKQDGLDKTAAALKMSASIQCCATFVQLRRCNLRWR